MIDRRHNATQCKKINMVHKGIRFPSFFTMTGFKPLASRVQRILHVKAPTKVKDTSSFVILVNLFNNRIPQGLKTKEPITWILKKGTPFF